MSGPSYETPAPCRPRWPRRTRGRKPPSRRPVRRSFALPIIRIAASASAFLRFATVPSSPRRQACSNMAAPSYSFVCSERWIRLFLGQVGTSWMPNGRRRRCRGGGGISRYSPAPTSISADHRGPIAEGCDREALDLATSSTRRPCSRPPTRPPTIACGRPFQQSLN
jgi:hypothetical protein